MLFKWELVLFMESILFEIVVDVFILFLFSFIVGNIRFCLKSLLRKFSGSSTSKGSSFFSLWNMFFILILRILSKSNRLVFSISVLRSSNNLCFRLLWVNGLMVFGNLYGCDCLFGNYGMSYSSIFVGNYSNWGVNAWVMLQFLLELLYINNYIEHWNLYFLSLKCLYEFITVKKLSVSKLCMIQNKY
jgi:hypothetical protein